MTKRYQFGNPIETEAVLYKPDITKGECEWLQQSGRGFSCHLSRETIVYGLGESVRGINKRGWLYRSFCSDEPEHREDRHSLYGAHNFLLLSGDVYRKEDTEDALPGQKNIGFFFDTPGEIVFDIGYTKSDQMEITFSDFDLELYVMEGDSPDEVVSEFRELAGRSYIPPKWAFGYGQSRWSYETSDDVRKIAEEHKRLKIPLDSVYLDIDYMERYKDFTIDEKNFGDFDQLVREMKEEKIHLVPIIDAGVKIEEGYDVYEEGKEKGYFCKDENGEDFTVGVWPGKCHFPDMLNEEARHWFGDKYHLLTDRGIDGFWNDMNEPAIFYSEKRLEKVFSRMRELMGENLDIDTFFEMTGMVAGIANHREDYESFYHSYPYAPGDRKIRHDKVHNLYGYYMTRAAAESLEKLSPEKRILLFSRASYIGMHRYGGIWQGDNMSWWSHLLLNIKMMPSLNMCGFLYTGADLGGFGSDTTEELLLRFLSFGVFTPLMRNHAAKGTRRQEIYCFENIECFRDILKVRYRLLPYLYSEYMKAALRGTMMFRPLAFRYPGDKIARHVEDQLLLGEELMIAPVYEQNAIGRAVYIPERMKLFRFRGDSIDEERVYEKGYYFVDMPLGDICIFLREGHKIPVADSALRVENVPVEKLEIYSFGEKAEPYELYADDGETREYSLEKNIIRI